MDIKPGTFKQLFETVNKAKNRVPANDFWRWMMEEHGIGTYTPQQKHIELNSAHRLQIYNWCLQEHGVDVKNQTLDEVLNRTRHETSMVSNREKTLSARPRQNLLDVRSSTYMHGKATHTANGYMGLTIDDVLESPYDAIVTVENFDTFIRLVPAHLPIQEPHCLYLFRGDNKADPVDVKELLVRNSKPHYHFGDFDPAGVLIGLQMNCDLMLIPDLAQITVKELKDRHTYEKAFWKQEKQVKALKNRFGGKPTGWIQQLIEAEIAVMQEAIISRELPVKAACFP